MFSLIALKPKKCFKFNFPQFYQNNDFNIYSKQRLNKELKEELKRS